MAISSRGFCGTTHGPPSVSNRHVDNLLEVPHHPATHAGEGTFPDGYTIGVIASTIAVLPSLMPKAAVMTHLGI